MITERKMAIIEAFKNLVRRFGVDKTTMQDVAREVGISVGLIYKDFINKDDLIDAYIRKIVDQIIFECRRLGEQNKPPKELLHDVLIGFCEQLGEHISQDRGFFQCIFGNIQVGQLRQKTARYKDAFTPIWQNIIINILEKGQAEGVFRPDDSSNVACCLMDAFGFFAAELAIINEKQPEEILPQAERMFNFIIRAIEK